MVMYDNEFQTKEDKSWTKDKIEPQHIHWLAIHHGCPNIVLIDKVDSRVKIIDIAVLWDANVESKYREKVDHYKYLAIELSSL